MKTLLAVIGGLSLAAVAFMLLVGAIVEVQEARRFRRVARAWRAAELDREADGIAQAADAADLTPAEEASAAECQRRMPAPRTWAMGRLVMRGGRPETLWSVDAESLEAACARLDAINGRAA